MTKRMIAVLTGHVRCPRRTMPRDRGLCGLLGLDRRGLSGVEICKTDSNEHCEHQEKPETPSGRLRHGGPPLCFLYCATRKRRIALDRLELGIVLEIVDGVS